MANKKTAIFLVISVLVAIAGCGKEPTAYYREAKGATKKVDNAIQNGDFESALAKCKEGLAKLEFLEKRFPDWEDMALVGPLKEELRKNINLIESRLQIKRGYDYQQEEKFEEALVEYKVVLEKYADQPLSCAIAQRAIGNTYFQQGKYEEALKAYNLVLEKYKDYSRLTSSIAQASVGKIYILTGKYEEALKAHNAVLSEYRDQADACVIALYEIGYIYQKMGKHDQALEAWRELVSDYDGHPYARITELLLEALQIEPYQKVEEEYREILPLVLRFFSGQISHTEFLTYSAKLGKEYESNALFFIAAKYRMDGKTDEAVEYYNRCIEVSGGKGLAHDMALRALEKIESK
ncbi:MAG: tetratricopeptide repeat protein [Candidatus Omnitrophota bacterium]